MAVSSFSFEASKTVFASILEGSPPAIKRIFDAFPNEIFVSDAGSHTTFEMLLYNARHPNHLLFPGAFAPMGYGLPAGIGAAVATGRKIIVFNGDGGFQMNLQ